MLMVGASGSGEFGTTDRLKGEIIAELSALLALSAIRNNDRVGLIIFTDRIECFIPPKKGSVHVWRVIREILSFRPTRRATDLAGALEYLSKVLRRRSVIFVISDFLDEGFSERLRVAAGRHDVTAVAVGDRREAELPPIGILELEDAETGETILIDTYDRNTTRGFRLLAGEGELVFERLADGTLVSLRLAEADLEASEELNRQAAQRARGPATEDEVPVLAATRAAVEEGVVPGGGVALVRAIDGLAGMKGENHDQDMGINILRRAVEEPLRQIANNAGLEGSVVIDKVKNSQGASGYNADTDT